MSIGADTLDAVNAGYVDGYPGEAARALESLPAEEVRQFLEAQPAERASRILSALRPDLASEVLERADATMARRLLGRLDAASAAALLARIETADRERLLGAVDPVLAEEIRGLIAYPSDSAGRLMDPRVLAFRPEETVRQVLGRLRRVRGLRIHDLFLIDAEGRLAGWVPLQEVALAEPADRIGTLLRGAPHVVATASREQVLEELQTHRAASLPVVSYDGRLVGVIRQAALVEAAQAEASAGIQTMVGASAEERALSSPLFAVRKRLPWLQVNLGTAFLAAAVVGVFEDTIARNTALAVLLPVVAGQSGNTGAQALAVTMRGLALREIRTRHWLRVSVKEVIGATLNGVAVAATTSLGVYLWSGSPGLTLVIGISMVISMTMAGLAGALIPLGLTAIRQDPAQSSSIILTTVTDVVGFFSFLGIATVLASLL